MEYEWDEAKRLANLKKHGVDFEDIDEFDWPNSIEWIDGSEDYAEERILALGPFRGRIYSVAYTERRGKPASLASEKPLEEKSRAMKKKKIDLADYEDVAADDPDNPEWTEEMFKRARPMRENPEMLKRMLEASANLRERKKHEPDRSKLGNPGVQVTLRLDEEVLNSFKEDGPGWQERINGELKKIVKRAPRKRRK